MTKISILYESEGLIAVHKPEGLLSIPGDGTSGNSLVDRLTSEIDGKLFTIHRLDRDASGVILFAKNSAAHRELNEQFSNRSVTKRYLALVHGRLNPAEGVIDRPIRQFGSGRMGVDEARGKPSLTHYRVIDRGAAYSLLEVRPTTGRRHQIRVHLYSIGHSLVGDLRYGDRTAQKEFPRLMLHASSLRVTDPSTDTEVWITAPTPASFQQVCDRLV